MSNLTLVGGTTNRFVLEDGTEGRLALKKDPTDKQVEKGTPVAVVFIPDVPADVVVPDEPGREPLHQPKGSEDE